MSDRTSACSGSRPIKLLKELGRLLASSALPRDRRPASRFDLA